jgi:hypothetical protein
MNAFPNLIGSSSSVTMNGDSLYGKMADTYRQALSNQMMSGPVT